MVEAMQRSTEARSRRERREGGERIALSSRGGQKPPKQADGGIYAEEGAAKRAGRRNAEEKDTEKERREPGETKVGQRPGHVEKNGAHNVQDGDTLSYSSKRPFSAAAPGSAACPFRKRCAITRLAKMMRRDDSSGDAGASSRRDILFSFLKRRRMFARQKKNGKNA